MVRRASGGGMCRLSICILLLPRFTSETLSRPGQGLPPGGGVYCIIFPNLSDRAVHGLGASLQLDTASRSQLGSNTTILQPFYAFSL